jgi:WD40 repeat protein
VRVWDAASGAAMMPPFQGHEGRVESVVFSSDGTRIRSTSGIQAWTWDVTTGVLCDPMGVHSQDDGFILPVIMLDADRRVVDVSQQRTLMKVPGIVAEVDSATSGKSLVIGGQGGHVVILNFPEALFSSPETRPAETHST